MTDLGAYHSFLASKATRAEPRGLRVLPAIGSALKPFQRTSTEFLLQQGSGALFLDTGLGKTICELEWATHTAAASNGRALILTPLAVAWQIKREADKFGYQARVIRSQEEAGEGINICNYDRLDALDPAAFGAVALDESSIIKNFSGKTTRVLTDAFRNHRWKLAATATPAPNDHMEIGTHSEFLSVMASNEMLSRFFINDTSTASQKWRLKGHAERPFWDWMASWSRMASLPSDLGDSDEGYFLPPMHVFHHKAEDQAPVMTDGLFGALEVSATSMYNIKRQTTAARVKMAAKVVLGDISWQLRNAEPSSSATTNATKTSGSSRQNRSSERTRSGGNVAAPTQSTEKPSGKRSRKASCTTPTLPESEICEASSGSACRTIEPCISSKTEPAQFAEQGIPVKQGISTSITATAPGQFAGFSAADATSRSACLATIQRQSEQPPSTSKSPMGQSWILWCDTNEEQDALEREFGTFAISIRGSQSADEKEHLCRAWMAGERPILITKPAIFGYGMNFQHCCNMLFVGRSFSYELFYQAVRRCWRFGQQRPVSVHLIVAEGEDAIGRVIDRKADDHARMKAAMSAAMRRSVGRGAQTKTAYEPKHEGRLPAWLSAA